jgi:hypothetical protein
MPQKFMPEQYWPGLASYMTWVDTSGTPDGDLR